MKRKTPESYGCDEARQGLQHLWVEGYLGNVISGFRSLDSGGREGAYVDMATDETAVDDEVRALSPGPGGKELGAAFRPATDPEFHAESCARLRKLAEHLDACQSCRREVESLVNVDQALMTGFAAFDRSTELPERDQIATLLHRVVDEPTVRLLRRTRRSIRVILWLCFFLFTLLGCSALIALAWKALFER